MTVAGRRVQLVSLGSGERRPLLLVHGLGGRWQNWLANIPRLARTRQVVAVDLPGFGRSQMPLEPISIEGWTQALDRVCDLLELEAPAIVGHSLGGLVATELALRFPQRAGALVLVDAATLTPVQLRARTARIAVEGASRLIASLPRGAITRPRARHLAYAGVIRHPTLIARDLLYELGGETHPPGTLQALAALAAHDIAGELAQITAPTLIVHGTGDVLIPAQDSERLAALLPESRLELFADTGHMPMVERPVRFNDLLEDFLA
jgi:pimeloyl-ACP methyl ester carboxylesterase